MPNIVQKDNSVIYQQKAVENSEELNNICVCMRIHNLHTQPTPSIKVLNTIKNDKFSESTEDA
jgi:hypothetical protein